MESVFVHLLPQSNVAEVPNVRMNKIKKKLNFLCGIPSKFN